MGRGHESGLTHIGPDGAALAERQVGEIALRGPTVMHGYLPGAEGGLQRAPLLGGQPPRRGLAQDPRGLPVGGEERRAARASRHVGFERRARAGVARADDAPAVEREHAVRAAAPDVRRAERAVRGSGRRIRAPRLRRARVVVERAVTPRPGRVVRERAVHEREILVAVSRSERHELERHALTLPGTPREGRPARGARAKSATT